LCIKLYHNNVSVTVPVKTFKVAGIPNKNLPTTISATAAVFPVPAPPVLVGPIEDLPFLALAALAGLPDRDHPSMIREETSSPGDIRVRVSWTHV